MRLVTKPEQRQLSPLIMSLVLLAASLLVSGMGVYVTLAAPSNSGFIANMVTFEGQLIMAGGNVAEDGLYVLTFRLYDAASGGNQVWTDANKTVQVVDGAYTVQLGDAQHPFPADAFTGPRWLGITVGTGSELAPRIPIHSVPFALNVNQALRLQGNLVSTQAPADGQVLTWNATSTQWVPQTAPTPNATKPSVRVYSATNLSVANNNLTLLNFANERWDPNNMHAQTSPNYSRLTVGTGQQGRYYIFASVQFAANANGQRMIVIRLTRGGVTTILVSETRNNSGSLAAALTASTVYNLAVGDYVELLAWQNSGVALNAQLAANYSPDFGMIRLGD